MYSQAQHPSGRRFRCYLAHHLFGGSGEVGVLLQSIRASCLEFCENLLKVRSQLQNYERKLYQADLRANRRHCTDEARIKLKSAIHKTR